MKIIAFIMILFSCCIFSADYNTTRIAYDSNTGLYAPVALGTLAVDVGGIIPLDVVLLSLSATDADILHGIHLDQYTDFQTPRKDETKKLNIKQYKLINESYGKECSICLTKINETNQSTSEMVQLNCPGNHIFCKACIEESYKYQQICPNCRGKISEKD